MRQERRGELLKGRRRVLVVGKRSRKLTGLAGLLNDHPCTVRISSNPMDAIKQNEGDDVDFVIMMETPERKIDEDLLSRLKAFFPTAKFLVIADRVTRDREVVMRSKGLIFLGSYYHFLHFHQEIMGFSAGPGEASLPH